MWQYFNFTDLNNIVVKKCLKSEICYKVSSSNMTFITHIKQHGIPMSTGINFNNQSVITPTGPTTQNNAQSPHEFRNKIMTDILSQWAAFSSFLFLPVDSTSFIKLTGPPDGEYFLMSWRSTQSKIIVDCESGRVKIKSTIHIGSTSYASWRIPGRREHEKLYFEGTTVHIISLKVALCII